MNTSTNTTTTSTTTPTYTHPTPTSELTRGQKSARTRKWNKARKEALANYGSGAPFKWNAPTSLDGLRYAPGA